MNIQAADLSSAVIHLRNACHQLQYQHLYCISSGYAAYVVVISTKPVSCRDQAGGHWLHSRLCSLEATNRAALSLWKLHIGKRLPTVGSKGDSAKMPTSSLVCLYIAGEAKMARPVL